jgi:hypothetical protein
MNKSRSSVNPKPSQPNPGKRAHADVIGLAHPMTPMGGKDKIKSTTIRRKDCFDSDHPIVQTAAKIILGVSQANIPYATFGSLF